MHSKIKILILRLDHLGDFILFLNSAQYYREIYPSKKYHITLLGTNRFTELAKEFPYWDEVYDFDRTKFARNIFYRIKLLGLIRKLNFDVIIQPRYSRERRYEDVIVRKSGIRERIGFENNDIKLYPQLVKSNKLYNKRIPSNPNILMELDRNAEFISGLLNKNIRPQIADLSNAFINEKSTYTKNSYFIICPGGTLEKTLWPIQNYKNIIEYLHNKTGLKCIICGSHTDKNRGNDLEIALGSKVINLTGKTPLPQFIQLIRNCKFLLGNDSGAIHLAAALSIPSLCVLGGGHYSRFLPYSENSDSEYGIKPQTISYKMDCFQCNWKCIFHTSHKKAFPCLENITVESVIKLIDQFLKTKLL